MTKCEHMYVRHFVVRGDNKLLSYRDCDKTKMSGKMTAIILYSAGENVFVLPKPKVLTECSRIFDKRMY